MAGIREQPAGFLLKSYLTGEVRRPYVLYVPPEYGSGHQRWPLIVFMHGAGECGSDGLKQVLVGIGSAIMLKREEWPFLVLLPQKPEANSRWEQYESMVLGVMEETQRHYRVDASRIYLTGLSQGGFGTWTIGSRHPQIFAALAPICGGGDPARAPALCSLPIWAFHGELDDVVSVNYSIDMVNAVNLAGGNARLTIFPQVGHGSWDAAYRTQGLAAWFLEHRRR